MAYSGNVRRTGSVQVDIAGAGTLNNNSGQVASIVVNGVGDTTLTMDTDRAYTPAATFKVECTDVEAITRIVLGGPGTTVQVLTFDDLAAPVDADYQLIINDVFN